MSDTIEGLGLGWLPDYPDFRDYTPDHEAMKPMTRAIGVEQPMKSGLPDRIDLRRWCSPVESQGSIGSCTANAGVGMLEFYEKRAFGKHIDASRLFLYKVTRNLLGWTGDTGAFLRTTMGAMVLFGVLPEKYWPYVVADFEKEPTAFCYAFAQSYQALRYYRLDPPVAPKDQVLGRIKTFLAHKMPSIFGFTVFTSIGQAGAGGTIPYPCPNDGRRGGHAVMAVGYDDNKKIKNRGCDKETTGAILIRNSWGTGWGDKGYGWLPYEFVLKGLATDWWALMKSEYVDTGKFKL